MKRRYFILLWLALLGVSGWYCLGMRNKIAEFDYSAAALSEAAMMLDTSDDRDMLNKNTPFRWRETLDFAELAEQSEVIVRVRANENRYGKYHLVLSIPDVLQVYKGGDIGESISVYEWGWRFPAGLYRQYGSYNLMTPGEEYVLFLQKIGWPDEYGIAEQEYLLTNVNYGKISVETSHNMQTIDKEHHDNSGSVKYAEFADWDIITDNPNLLEGYLRVRDEVLRNF